MNAIDAYHAARARQEALVPKYAKKLRRALQLSVEPAIALHEAGASPELAAAGVTSKEVIAVLAALYVDCGLAEARITYDSLTPAVKALAPVALVSQWGQRLKNFITGEGAESVRRITETTRKKVRQVLQHAAAAGDGVAVAAKKLRDEVAAFSVARSKRIVRTELVSASNYGSTLGAEATGLRLEKFWLATPGPRTRETHQAANGQGAALQGGMFTVGGYPCRYPGDPILPAGERVNCRCSIGYRRIT
jgi:hypothetical protein